MPLAKIKDFNALIDNKPFFNQPIKTNKKHMKNVLKYQEIMPMQQEIYQTFCIIKIIISLLVWIYYDKQIQIFLTKLKEDDGATRFFIAKKQQSCCKPFFRLINCNRINLRMERQKILNLSDKASNSKTAKSKWNINIKG